MAGALQSCFMFHNLLLQRNNSPPHLSTTRPYKICIFIQRSFILAKIYIVVPLGIRWMKDEVSLQDHSESTILFHMA